MTYPKIVTYPTRSIAESNLENSITERLFGEKAVFSCLEDRHRAVVEAEVLWMLGIMEDCGYFAGEAKATHPTISDTYSDIDPQERAQVVLARGNKEFSLT